MDGEKFETFRVKGFGKVKRNDVVVFNFPYTDWNHLQPDLNVYYLKRCVAISGDTFSIEDGIYKVKNSSDILGNYENQYHFSQLQTEEVQSGNFYCFPLDDSYQWNVKSFGPLYIPRKGDTLAIDSRNILLYRNLITYETDKEISVHADTVYLADTPLLSYVFQQNYYFMAGDYVFDSRDSRYWGLLPEDHIVGKATVILQSKDRDTGKRRWERFLKAIQ
jgi:signal peptidase I